MGNEYTITVSTNRAGVRIAGESGANRADKLVPPDLASDNLWVAGYSLYLGLEIALDRGELAGNPAVFTGKLNCDPRFSYWHVLQSEPI